MLVTLAAHKHTHPKNTQEGREKPYKSAAVFMPFLTNA